MQVRLNAFDRKSSESFSKLVDVNSKEEFEKAVEEFELEVPFSRWYSDHTNESDSVEVDKWLIDY